MPNLETKNVNLTYSTRHVKFDHTVESCVLNESLIDSGALLQM